MQPLKISKIKKLIKIDRKLRIYEVVWKWFDIENQQVMQHEWTGFLTRRSAIAFARHPTREADRWDIYESGRAIESLCSN